VKTSEIDFQYPVLGFTPDIEIWGFKDLNTLTSCGPKTLADDLQAGMELVDSTGRRWAVKSVRGLGPIGSIFHRAIARVLYGKTQTRIEHELEPLSPVSLQEVQAKACAVIEAHPTDYFEFFDDNTDLESQTGPVRATKSIAEIYDLLGPDTFEPY
jgi:hypothetical protein